MHVKRLEIQGFKTFAKKTTLSFLSPSKTGYPITAIVGPNGSGKSNLADAMRWVLGEQSLKLLRGKASDDVIFSGSEGRGRSGFAEVSITFDNTDRVMPIEFDEVTITRRLFRDGSSEYLVNQAKTRLSDIQLLLAQANVGQRSYSVIAQGMIDHVLISGPEERKAFFDDATGVKPFQLKRHESVLKLKRTYENLHEVEMVLREIEPRLKSLKRQANRLEKREAVESELANIQSRYYGTLWWNLQDKHDTLKRDLLALNKQLTDRREELADLERKTESVEQADTRDEGLARLQTDYRNKQRERDRHRQDQFSIEKEIELSKVRAQSNWAPLPLMNIISEVKEVVKGLRGLRGLRSPEDIAKAIETLLKRSRALSKRLERPNPKDIKPDPKLVSQLERIKKLEDKSKTELARIEKDIDGYAKKEQRVRSDLIEIQRMLLDKQSQIHELENRKNVFDIDVARLEEREQALAREMDEHMKEHGARVRKSKSEDVVEKNSEDLYPDIQRLRYKLELIGGIDPEVMVDHAQTQERFDFLDGQTKDLKDGIRSTEKVIKELDEKIESQSKKVFADINKKFDLYFKVLFGGGSAKLIKLTGNEEETTVANDEEVSKLDKKLEQHKDPVVGVDIQATPPGKKLKALNLLSGGERALTSIALLSAIMDVNPSPFVVLDEVDAALDEANTYRFASILEELAHHSQFILITHNRATMEKANVLYGVTMGKEGVSNLLSVHLKDVAKEATARR